VDPVVPERLQSQILRETEVRVRVGIDPDGLVYRVEVPPDALVGLETPIQNALRRWRFEPVSDPVTVTVTLVFRPEE
jgi:outer membrane biosynthesis protein TonB